MSGVQLLTRYKDWADGVFLATVAQVPAAELEAPRPIVFGSLLRTLNHACAMDFVWQCHLLGRPHGLTTRNPAQCPAFEDLRRRQGGLDAWYVQYAASLPAAALDEVVAFQFIGGGAGAMTRGEILLHVVNHGTYHRGHAADMLYTLGVFPPATDLPVFLREAAAAP